MSNIKTIAILNPTTVATSPVMTPIPKPTLVNTQFKPVAKPSTQETPPFKTITLNQTPIVPIKSYIIQPETKLPPLPPSPIKNPATSSMMDFLPLIGLGVIGLFVLSRNQ